MNVQITGTHVFLYLIQYALTSQINQALVYQKSSTMNHLFLSAQGLENHDLGYFDCICPDLKVKHSGSCVDVSLCSVCHTQDALCIVDETVPTADLTSVRGSIFTITDCQSVKLNSKFQSFDLIDPRPRSYPMSMSWQWYCW